MTKAYEQFREAFEDGTPVAGKSFVRGAVVNANKVVEGNDLFLWIEIIGVYPVENRAVIIPNRTFVISICSLGCSYASLCLSACFTKRRWKCTAGLTFMKL